MFEPTEEVLDEVAFLVDVAVDLAARGAIGLRRDDDGHSFGFDGLRDRTGIVAFVGDEVACPGCLDELRRFGDVVDVSGGEVEVDRVAQSVDEGMDFRSGAASRASNTLILGPPFPPAAC